MASRLFVIIIASMSLLTTNGQDDDTASLDILKLATEYAMDYLKTIPGWTFNRVDFTGDVKTECSVVIDSGPMEIYNKSDTYGRPDTEINMWSNNSGYETMLRTIQKKRFQTVVKEQTYIVEKTMHVSACDKENLIDFHGSEDVDMGSASFEFSLDVEHTRTTESMHSTEGKYSTKETEWVDLQATFEISPRTKVKAKWLLLQNVFEYDWKMQSRVRGIICGIYSNEEDKVKVHKFFPSELVKYRKDIKADEDGEGFYYPMYGSYKGVEGISVKIQTEEFLFEEDLQEASKRKRLNKLKKLEKPKRIHKH